MLFGTRYEILMVQSVHASPFLPEIRYPPGLRLVRARPWPDPLTLSTKRTIPPDIADNCRYDMLGNVMIRNLIPSFPIADHRKPFS